MAKFSGRKGRLASSIYRIEINGWVDGWIGGWMDELIETEGQI